jgi:hypothetical protein
VIADDHALMRDALRLLLYLAGIVAAAVGRWLGR